MVFGNVGSIAGNLKQPFVRADRTQDVEDGTSSGGVEMPATTTHRRTMRLKDCQDYESSLLSKALEDAGHWAYGVSIVELWILNTQDDSLYCPRGGTWVDMTLHPTHKTAKDYEECLSCRMSVEDHPNYIKPRALPPGVGLAGALWSELGRAEPTTRRSSIDESHHTSVKSVSWRNMQALVDDPDQPYNERIQNQVQFGMKWAAAIPFNIENHRGVLIYMAKKSVDLNQLEVPVNTQYLLAATNYISILWALRIPRMAAVQNREERLACTLRRVRVKILAVVRMGLTLADVRSNRLNKPETGTGHEPHTFLSTISDPLAAAQKLMEEGKKTAEFTYNGTQKTCSFTRRKILTVLRKCRGVNVRAPPTFTWEATGYAFMGTLITMLSILHFNYRMEATFGDGYFLTLGPMASFVACIYGLTAAPASQPRNNLVAQFTAMVIGLCVSYVEGIPVWVRQSFSVSLLVALMVKFGFIHAPASAVALTFATGQQNWTNIISMMIGNIIIILIGMLVNNLSDKRQYPTSWGLMPIIEGYEKVKKRRKRKKAA